MLSEQFKQGFKKGLVYGIAFGVGFAIGVLTTFTIFGIILSLLG